MSDPRTARIVHALRGAESPLRDEVVELAVDYVLGLRLVELFDFDAAKTIVVRALGTENLARILAKHARPGFDRYTLQVDASTETLGALVPETARSRIRRLIDEGPRPRVKWAANLVEPALVRKLFAPVWANLFASFAKRMPIPGVSAFGASDGAVAGAGGLGAGLAGRLTRTVQEHAEKIVDRGRSAMGGLGAEVEKRIQAAARDFSEGAAGIFREALQARLASPEGRKIVGEMSAQILDRLLEAKLAALHEDAKRADVSEILQISAEVVGHSVTHPFVAEAIEREVTAFVELEGERVLRDVLDEHGVLDPVRAVAVSRIGSVARGLFGTPEFADWVTRLLDA